MKKKNRFFALFLALSMIVGSLTQNVLVFASDKDSIKENEAVFYEIISTPNEDSTEVSVEIKIDPKENITVNTVALPDGREQAYMDTPVIYTAKENGLISFQLKYTAEDMSEKEVSIEYEINGIKDIKEEIVDETPQKAEKMEEPIKSEGEKLVRKKRATANVSNGTNLTDWEYREENGEIILTKYIGTSKDVVIPARLDGKPVVIDDSVNRPFFTVSIQSLVVGSETEKVKLLKINENTPNYWKGVPRLFEGLNKSLVTCDLRGLDVSEIENMVEMFRKFSELQTIDISGWDASKVGGMSEMFAMCSSLHTVNMRNVDMSDMKNLRWMFESCDSLKTVDMSGVKIGNQLLSYTGMFKYCDNLQVIDVGALPFTTVFPDNTSVFPTTGKKVPTIIINPKQIWFHDDDCEGRIPAGPKYNANGGTFDDGTTEKTYFDSIFVKDKAALQVTQKDVSNKFIPKKTGYTFDGWYLDKDLKTPYEANDTAVDLTTPKYMNDVTLYAKYKLSDYVLQFDANTGKGTMNDVIYHINDSVTLPANTFTKAGYTFTGWNTKADGQGTSYADGETLNPMPTNSMTLYAQWEAKNYTVKYDTQGGSAVADKTVHFEDDNLLPAVNPTKDGSTFIGWKLADVTKSKTVFRKARADKMVDNTMTYESLVADDTVTSITLVAVWKDHEYSVKYETGFDDVVIADKENVKWNDTNLLPNTPKKDGYGFIGWELNGKEVLATDKYSDLTNDQTDGTFITLTAKWVELTDYSILYNPNGGSMPANTPATLTGLKYADKVPTPVPLREGYTFKGWKYNDKEVKENSLYKDLEKDGDVKQIELVADWEINKYNVEYIFTSKDTPADVKLPSKEIVEYNTTLTEPKFEEYKGWRFNGWYADEALTQKFDFTTQIKADTKLYGAWDYKEEKPNNKPSKPNQKPSKTDIPKTGDATNLGLFASLLGGSGSMLLGLNRKKRKRNKND